MLYVWFIYWIKLLPNINNRFSSNFISRCINSFGKIINVNIYKTKIIERKKDVINYILL